MSAVQVLAALASTAFLDPRDLFDPGPDGLPRPKPLAAIPPDVRRSLQAVRVRGRGDTATVEYVVADKPISI